MFVRIELTGYAERAGVSSDAQLVEFGVGVELEQGNLGEFLAEFSGTADSVFIGHHVGDARDSVGLADADVGEDGGVGNVIDQSQSKELCRSDLVYDCRIGGHGFMRQVLRVAAAGCG